MTERIKGGGGGREREWNLFVCFFSLSSLLHRHPLSCKFSFMQEIQERLIREGYRIRLQALQKLLQNFKSLQSHDSSTTTDEYNHILKLILNVYQIFFLIFSQ